jgi:hypothetical protein
VRDEPGPGGVRVGATRTDLDCRVVATSRRVAPTECDSILPLFGRDSTCRLRLLGSWPPRAEAVVFDSSRGSTRVSRLVAPTESDSSDIRHTWGVAQLVRLVRLCRTLSDEDVTAHAPLVRHAPLEKSAPDLPPDSTSTRQTPRFFPGRLGSPGDRHARRYPLGASMPKFDQLTIDRETTNPTIYSILSS